MRNKVEKKYFIFDKNTGDIVHTVTHFSDENAPEDVQNLTDEKVLSLYQNHQVVVEENRLEGKTMSDFHVYNPDSSDDDVKKGRIHLFKFNNGSIDKITEEQFNQNKQIQTVGG